MTNPTPGLRANEREAFEAAYTLKLLTIKDAERAFRRLSHTPDEYEVASVHAAWVMWQARAALSPKPATSDEREAQGVSLGAEGMGWAPSKPAAPVAVPEGYVRADTAFSVRDLFDALCDLAAEANAVDTVIGRPDVLRQKLSALRDRVGAAPNGYICATPAPEQQPVESEPSDAELDALIPGVTSPIARLQYRTAMRAALAKFGGRQ